MANDVINKIKLGDKPYDIGGSGGGGSAEWVGTTEDWANDTGSIPKDDLEDGDIVNFTNDYDSNICNTIADCIVSTNPDDVAGKDTIVELNNKLTHNNYEIKNIQFNSSVASKTNEYDGAVLYKYKNGIIRIAGLVNINVQTSDYLFTVPIPPTKQHWCIVTRATDGRTFSCRLSEEGRLYNWGEVSIQTGTYVIDTVY